MARGENAENKVQCKCQDECKSRCCRYITINLPAPRCKADYDELSWFLAHQDISVYVEARRWHLEVRTPCKYLDKRNLCTIYETRPEICREYALDSCEYPARPAHSLHFDAKEEFDSWLLEKKEHERKKRKIRNHRLVRLRRMNSDKL